MKKIYSIFTLLVVALIGLSLTACSSDDLNTNQYKGGVSLNAFGPNPVMRGGQLRFVGSNLDQIASINIPGVGEITNITVVKAGVPSEIRVTVPKDGPVEGVITLTTKTGSKITTESQLAFEEPIEITGFSPASAMPGDVIKIEGDYLNLIHSLAFADGVVVGENDFVSHDRYYIEVAVPENAQTGRLELYTADLTIQLDEDEDELEYQIIETEDALEVGVPTTATIASPRGAAGEDGVVTAKAGETITFTGTYYNVIAAVNFGGVEVTDVTISEDGKTITVTLPAEAPDGDINLVCKSGIEVPVGTLNTVKPSNGVATPNPVKAGTVLTINGNDMDLVTGIIFDNVADAVAVEAAADKVTVTVPAEAKEGDLQLVMANGATVAVPFTLVKPTVTAYDNATVSAGAALTIQGTDLDLVTKVQFGDGTTEVSGDGLNIAADGSSITLTVPMDAQSGAPTLTLANGYEVENVPSLTINEALFCYATALPGEEDEVKAGNSMTITVANGDKLTGVEMNGETCQWILTGEDKNQLIIGIPETAKAKSTLRLISSNGEITYDIAVIPATSVSKTIWTGLTQITWGDGGRVIIPAKAFDSVPAGAILTVAYSQVDQQWDQAQFNYGNWSGINFTESGEGITAFNQTLVPTEVYGWFSDGILNRETSMILTQEILNNIQANKGECEGQTDCGIIIQGSGLTFSKVTISWEISLETDLASVVSNMNGTPITYPYTFTWDDTGRFILSQSQLNEIGVKKGSKFIVYKDASATGQIQINNSSWSAIYYLADWNGTEEVLEQEFDDALMEAVNNGGLVLQGAISGINKMTILP